jgi:DNA-binding PadR family transcriptional regulator
MGILTLNEEMILVALCRLGGETHGPVLREQINEITGKAIVYGTLYNSLEYLIRKRYVESRRGKPTPERGGKAKQIYAITPDGREALLETRQMRDRLWQGLKKADIAPGESSK